jgi:hypothetical protein
MAQYTYRAEWSPEYHEYVGVCLEYPYRYSRAPTAHQAIEGVERMIDEVVAEMTAAGAAPGIPDRPPGQRQPQGANIPGAAFAACRRSR